MQIYHVREYLEYMELFQEDFFFFFFQEDFLDEENLVQDLKRLEVWDWK